MTDRNYMTEETRAKLIGFRESLVYMQPLGMAGDYFMREFNLCPEWRILLQYMGIHPCPNDRRLMVLYMSGADAEKRRYTTGKPARLLGKIFPFANEKHKEAFAVWWRENVEIAFADLEIKTSKAPQDFARVYTMKQARASDPRLGADRKSLAASCMRHEFQHLPKHPTYIYGSGDFQIVWVENQHGELLGRYVASIRGGRYVRGPIYTNTNIAGDMLENYSDTQEKSATDNSHSWLNSRLLKIETSCGYLAPYMDRDDGIRDGGEFWVVSRNRAEHSFCETSGVIGGHEYYCENCHDGLHEDEINIAPDTGEYYCEHCFHSHFEYCNHCEEFHPRDEFTEIRGNGGQHYDVCDPCFSISDFVELAAAPSLTSIYAHLDDCVYCEESDQWFHVEDLGVFFFLSDESQEYFPIEDLAPLPKWFDAQMTTQEAIESGNWTLQTKREFVRFEPSGAEKYKTTVWLELKPWLEFIDGEIINRQIELAL